MTVEIAEATLIELFEAAAGDGAEVILPDGRRVSQLGQFGVILVNGRPSEQFEGAAEVRFRLAEDLRRAARDAFTDPARNPMIKLD